MSTLGNPTGKPPALATGTWKQLDTELGQATYRSFNACLILLYLVASKAFGWFEVDLVAPLCGLVYLGFSLCWIGMVRHAIFSDDRRRVIAAILDQAIPAPAIAFAGAVMTPVVVFVGIAAAGSGLRFGARYTRISSAVGVPLVGAAMYISPYWHGQIGVAISMLASINLLPLYSVALAERLQRAKHHAETRASQLETLARQDHLTGLLSRSGFLETLGRPHLWSAAARPQAYLIMLDLDGFKAINDTLGHAVGDTALQTVASALQSSVRASDSVGRLGGDEFAVLLEGVTSQEVAEAVAATILAAIQGLVIAGSTLRLGASLGICELGTGGIRTPEAALMKADELMYNAKAAGKNRYHAALLRGAQVASQPVLH